MSCNNNSLCGIIGDNWWWIIILILLFCFCGNGNGCGCDHHDSCGC